MFKYSKTILLFAWLIAYLRFPHPTFAEPSDFSAAHVPNPVDSIIAAYGGSENIIRHYNLPQKFTGEIIDKNKAVWSCTSIRAGEKNISISSLNGSILKDGFDGKNKWSDLDGSFCVFSKSENRLSETSNLARPITILMFLVQSHENSNFSKIGEKTITGELCEGISFLYLRNRKINVWFSKKNHLIRGIDLWSLNGSSSVRYDFDDYQLVSDFWIPFRMACHNQEVYYGGYKWNKAVSADESEIPSSEELAPKKLPQAVTCPLELSSGQVFVSGSINGHIAKFRIDTGAATSLLNGLYAKTYNIGMCSNQTHVRSALFSTSRCGKAKLQEMMIGNLKLNDCMLDVETKIYPSYAALIGMDILRRFTITLDESKETITFSEQPILEVPPGSVVVPMQLLKRPFVDGEINGTTLTFLMDSGHIGLPLLFHAINGVSAECYTRASVVSIRGPEKSRQAFRIPVKSMRIGNIDIRNPEVNVLASEYQGPDLLGLDSLKDFRKITFDFPGERLICLP